MVAKALAARELRGTSTRLLGRLSPPQPLGAICYLTAVLPPASGSGAPRVLAAGTEGHLFEWDLRGGRVTRALTHVACGLVAAVVDTRDGSDAMALARGDGLLQLWRWPSPMRTADPIVPDDDQCVRREAGAEPAAHRALHRAAAALAERASQPPAKRRKSSESD